MRVMIAQFQIKPEFLKEFEAARDTVLGELGQAGPAGVRYTWFRHAEADRFTGWLELEDGVENPLPHLAGGREFMAKIAGWVALPPQRDELQVAGEYRSERSPRSTAGGGDVR